MSKLKMCRKSIKNSKLWSSNLNKNLFVCVGTNQVKKRQLTVKLTGAVCFLGGRDDLNSPWTADCRASHRSRIGLYL